MFSLYTPLFFCVFLGIAYADCASPAGTVGELEYDEINNVYEFCNGAVWVPFETTDVGDCAETAKMQYNTGSDTYNFCDGTDLLEIDCVKGESGLIGYWKLDETSGTIAYDSSGNGNHGTMSGGLSAATDSVAGQVGTALNFNGSTDYINLGSAALFDNVSPVSICVWIYSHSFPVGYPSIIDKSNPSDGNDGWNFYTDDIGGDTIGYYSLKKAYKQPVAVDLNQWHHYCATWNGTDGSNGINIYKDGALFPGGYTGDFGAGTNDDSAFNLSIGASGSGTRDFFDGYLDDVQMYSRALSAVEVGRVYAQTSASCRLQGACTEEAKTNTFGGSAMAVCNGTNYQLIGN